MLIAECKKFKILPVMETRVKTIMDSTVNLPVGKVMNFYIGKRRDGNGVFIGMVKTTEERKGDFWWIQHDDGIAIYHSSEVFDR
jgi:hypothetical protein